MAQENVKEEVQKISRREFLKDAGLVVGGATIGSMAVLNACSATNTITENSTVTKTVTVPGNTEVATVTVTTAQAAAATNLITFTVNGQRYENVMVDPNDTLRDVLREKAGYTSIKDMCLGTGACGSCTVIMNDRPVLSCLMLAIECDGATIQTAEGIALAEHPLVEAYIQNYCMQCGYCTPGFIVTAKALLDRNPNPTEEDIRESLGGNICRCGTYPQHILAVLEAAKAL